MELSNRIPTIQYGLYKRHCMVSNTFLFLEFEEWK